ncbi:Putative mono-oxygenase ydhR [Rhizobiales bacterium GAS188]|nr:Putative mono-oxygenase ydhR [Rhizobiales bacterium GAS188]
MPVILQVSFVWDEDEEAVRAESLAQAQALARRDEFEWKLILRDAQSKISGAIYLFADRQKAEAWRNDLFERRGRDIEARIFEIDEDASRLTRAPIAPATGHGHAAAESMPIDELNASNDE